MYPTFDAWGMGDGTDAFGGLLETHAPPPPIEPVVTDPDWTDGTDDAPATLQVDSGPPGPAPIPEAIAEPDLKTDRLMARALTAGWNIPKAYVDAVINRQVVIAADPKGKPRDSTRAFNALVAATRAESASVAVQVNAQVAAQRVAAAMGEEMPVRPAASDDGGIPRVQVYLPDNGRDPE